MFLTTIVIPIFVSHFDIKLTEYLKNAITLKPRYFDHFDHGQMDAFNHFDHAVEMDLFEYFDCSQNECYILHIWSRQGVVTW